ncbi:MAG: OmpA family protein, partial [Bacteroidetes bacterium]|nr:OmpA family protein [Bacteroidota bacterium]
MFRKYLLTSMIVSGAIMLVNGQPDSSTATYKKEVLPPAVNSTYQEARPLISGNGKTLFFNRRKHPKNQGGPRDFQDIYVSYYDEQSNSWSVAENIGKTLNDRKRNAVAAINTDGTEGIFFNTYINTKRQPIARSRKTNKGWTEPVPITIQNYVNKSNFADFHLSFRENILLLAVDGDKTRGGQDLYVSFPDGAGGWKKPISLGPVLNTRKQEYAPFLAADGHTLFFCSDGHGGQGGSDIYMSIRLDNSWRKWSKPVNLGPSINTKQEESYFSFTDDMRYIYYSSHDNNESNRDIVRATLSEDFTDINGPVLARLDSVAIKAIMVSGNYTINPKGAQQNFQGVAFEGWPGSQEIATATALEYEQVSARSAEEPAVKEAIVKEAPPSLVSAEEDTASEVVTSDFRPLTASMQLPEEAKKLGEFLVEEFSEQEVLVRRQNDIVEFKIVEGIHYNFNSVGVDSEHLPRLQVIRKVLENQAQLMAVISGHADVIGTPTVNEQVSRMRAAYVESYLKSNGISSDRLSVEGKGANEPIADNNTPANRRKNRRVETILRLKL